MSTTLVAKRTVGVLPRVRDNALISLGRIHAELIAMLLLATSTTRLAAVDSYAADLLARCGKATGVDTAWRAVTELAPLKDP